MTFVTKTYAPVAQGIERSTPTRKVARSNRARRVSLNKTSRFSFESERFVLLRHSLGFTWLLERSFMTIGEKIDCFCLTLHRYMYIINVSDACRHASYLRRGDMHSRVCRSAHAIHRIKICRILIWLTFTVHSLISCSTLHLGAWVCCPMSKTGLHPYIAIPMWPR